MKTFKVRLSTDMPVTIKADEFHIDEDKGTLTFIKNDDLEQEPVDGYTFFISNIIFIKEEVQK